MSKEIIGEELKERSLKLFDGLEDGIKKYALAIESLENDSSILFDFASSSIKVFKLNGTIYQITLPKEEEEIYWICVESCKETSVGDLITELYEASL